MKGGWEGEEEGIALYTLVNRVMALTWKEGIHVALRGVILRHVLACVKGCC